MSNTELNNYSLEVSYGSLWVNLNDHVNYVVHADSTSSSVKSFRQIKAVSPIVEGDVLLHSVPDMVAETIKVWVYGNFQTEFEENMEILEKLFEQFRYQVRVTKNEHREVWECRMADTISVEINQASIHAMMGLFTVSVTRQPTVHREVAR